MPNVIVNIQGDASGLKNELESVSRISPQSQRGGSSLPPDERLIEEVRQQINQQKISTQASIENIKQEYEGKTALQISQKYDTQRQNMRNDMGLEYEKIDKQIEQQKNERLSQLGEASRDPLLKKTIEQQYEQLRETRYRQTGKKYDIAEQTINENERKELSTSETELTQAIKNLSDFFERQTRENVEGSYVNRLKEERQKYIEERDMSPDAQGAMDAQKKVRETEEKLRKIIGSEADGSSTTNKLMASLMLGQGANSMFNSLSRGDIAGSIMGGGTAIAGVASLFAGPEAGIAIQIATLIASGITEAFQRGGEIVDQAGEIGRYKSTAPGYSGEDARNAVIFSYQQPFFKEWMDMYKIKPEEMMQTANQRIRAGAMPQTWLGETLSSIGLEKDLGLDKGALTRGAQFDRYGTTVTDGISRLVTILTGIVNSGIKMNDFSRVQEKFDIQQSIMSGYLTRTDKPNYDTANKLLGAFSDVPGITQDTRLGTDIQRFQNLILHPANNRMKAMLFSTINDLFPEAHGRMDILDQLRLDPANEGKIMQSLTKRMNSQYGGPETMMGYWNWRGLMGEDMPTSRMKAEVNAVANGRTGDILKNGIPNQSSVNLLSQENRYKFEKEASQYFTDMTKFMTKISNGVSNLVSGTATKALPNQTK